MRLIRGGGGGGLGWGLIAQAVTNEVGGGGGGGGLEPSVDHCKSNSGRLVCLCVPLLPALPDNRRLIQAIVPEQHRQIKPIRFVQATAWLIIPQPKITTHRSFSAKPTGTPCTTR